MKLQSFENMESEYKTTRLGLEVDDLEERKILLEKYKFSIIIEGDYNEFDNLINWIEQNIASNDIESIFYGKTEYNFGFVEYFMNEKELEERLKYIIPNIFTIYPNAYPSQKISKTNGSNFEIEFDKLNKDSIILPNTY